MGPLHGLKVIEMAGIGPAPFCAMMLADMGADVVCVERASARPGRRETDCLKRNRRTIALDLKHPAAIEVLLELTAGADVLIEGFRPGVMERLGLGPEVCLGRNPRLVYGRMTGWGQSGPLAHAAGHDINYIAITGALHLIGERGRKPVPPLNLVGDFGGGAMMLLAGVLAALFEAGRSGRGQVIDAAMTDGTVALLGIFFAQRAAFPDFQDATGGEMLAGGAPYYDAYETRDGKFVAIGALEPQFYALLIEKLGLDPKFRSAGFPASRTGNDDLRAAIAAAVATRTRDEWAAVFEGTDACVAPVLTLAEAAGHPHNVARGTFVTVDGIEQHAPAPRFSRTVAGPVRPPRAAGADTLEVLQQAGFSEARIAALRAAGALS